MSAGGPAAKMPTETVGKEEHVRGAFRARRQLSAEEHFICEAVAKLSGEATFPNFPREVLSHSCRHCKILMLAGFRDQLKTGLRSCLLAQRERRLGRAAEGC